MSRLTDAPSRAATRATNRIAGRSPSMAPELRDDVHRIIQEEIAALGAAPLQYYDETAECAEAWARTGLSGCAWVTEREPEAPATTPQPLEAPARVTLREWVRMVAAETQLRRDLAASVERADEEAHRANTWRFVAVYATLLACLLAIVHYGN